MSYLLVLSFSVFIYAMSSDRQSVL